jgi:hypothetical protein
MYIYIYKHGNVKISNFLNILLHELLDDTPIISLINFF